MNLKLFDSHAHYDDAKFDEDPNRDELIAELFGSGDVEYVLNASCDVATSIKSIEFTQKYPGFYAAVGIHPENCGEVADIDRDLRAISELAKSDKVVAIGEIGLDYHYPEPSRELQKEFFERQMILARELGMPVIVHDRDAHGDCMDTVRRFPEVRGVFHSFSGSAQTAAELVKLGWYISFSGVITFKNASRVAEVVKTIPDDRILIETDCPYLAPEPNRGRRNNSGYMKFTAEKAAELRSVDVSDLISQTSRNAKTLFGIKGSTAK